MAWELIILRSRWRFPSYLVVPYLSLYLDDCYSGRFFSEVLSSLAISLVGFLRTILHASQPAMEILSV
jgi:hypothetical protein